MRATKKKTSNFESEILRENKKVSNLSFVSQNSMSTDLTAL